MHLNYSFMNIALQTHKGFKRMLFIRTKHNLQSFGVIPFISSYKTALKQQLNNS